MTRTLPRRPRRGDDRGFTLAELMAAMGVMVLFMTIATGSIVMMFRSSQHSEGVTRTSQQVNSAFLWLDRHLRYADYISDLQSGGLQVQFSAPESGAATSTPVCFSLRVDSGQLQWIKAGATAWQPLASGMVTSGAGVPAPLAVLRPGDARPGGAAGDVASRSELWVSLTVVQGSGDRTVQTQSQGAFIALNSAASGTGSHGACG